MNGFPEYLSAWRRSAAVVLLALALLAAWAPARAQELLEPRQAFRFEARMAGSETLEVTWRIADEHYMYRHAFSVSAPQGGVVLGEPDFPDGKKTHDQFFGEVVTYESDVSFTVPVTPIADGLTGFTIEAVGQGCNEPVGVCYPPLTETATIELAADQSPAPLSLMSGPGSGGAAAGGSGFQTGYWPVLLALVSGALLTFTPCVLPMVPILAAIIVGQGRHVTRLRGGSLASVYVLGTAATYTAVGVVAGLTGDQLQAWFQNIWAIGFLAVLMVLMALSMFGFYELRMPSGIQSRLQRRATGLQAGAFGGVFLMGMLSALIVGACVSPVLISILGLAINRGDPLLGGTVMFAMALGMGVFLVAMGFGFGYLLPRAGPWMERVKHTFGVLLLGVAVYLLGAIPSVPVLYLWAALLLGTAVYLGVHGIGGEPMGWKLARQLAAVALVAWGVMAVLGGMQGSRDILAPMDYRVLSSAPQGQAALHAQFQRVADQESLARLMTEARTQGKPVMVDYYADWCVDCVRMENTTFSEPRVARTLNERFALIQIDVTDPNDPGTRAVKRAHEVFGPPAMLFFDRQGGEVRGMRRYGYMDSEAFLDHIEPLASE